jgi:hypothetical protein
LQARVELNVFIRVVLLSRRGFVLRRDLALRGRREESEQRLGLRSAT